jgi:hypothetical protein
MVNMARQKSLGSARGERGNAIDRRNIDQVKIDDGPRHLSECAIALRRAKNEASQFAIRFEVRRLSWPTVATIVFDPSPGVDRAAGHPLTGTMVPARQMRRRNQLSECLALAQTNARLPTKETQWAMQRLFAILASNSCEH